jgi:hypothetical protein
MNDTSKITPIAPEYQTCLKCWIVLSAHITNSPKNEIAKLSAIEQSHFRNYHWRLSSKKHVASKDLREHIDWLIKILANAAFSLKEFYGVQFKLKCFWHSRYGDSGPTLWTEQTSALAKLGLDCTFDIYYENGQWNKRNQE